MKYIFMLIFAWLHIDVLFRFWNRKKVTIISYHNPTVAVFFVAYRIFNEEVCYNLNE